MKLKYVGVVAITATLCLLVAPVFSEKNGNEPKGDQTCCLNTDCKLNCGQNENGQQNHGEASGHIEGYRHGPRYRNPDCPNRVPK
jgi:hypothetical protein